MANIKQPKLLLVLTWLSISFHSATSGNGSTYYHQDTNETTLRHHYGVFNETKASLFMENEGSLSKDYFGETEKYFESTKSSYDSHLSQTSVIYGLTKVANGSNVNTLCYRQLQHIQKSIHTKHPWALKVLDGSATKPSGFMFGHDYWLGSRETCQAVQHPVGITLQRKLRRSMHYGIITQMAPFDMDFRVVYLKHNSPFQVEIKLMTEQVLHVGLCVPMSCTSSEIKNLTNDYLQSGMFVANDIYDIRPEVLYVKDLKLKDGFYERSSFKIFSSFVIFTLLMMTAASFLRVKEEEERTKGTKVHSNSNGERPIFPPSDDNQSINDLVPRKVKEFVKCFDLQSNTGKLFKTKQSTPNEIPIINGIRSICASWIILFHVFWYMYFTVNNKTSLITYAEKMVFQYISSSPLLVDLFFVISAFLQTYNFIKNTKQMEMIRRNSFGQNAKHFLKAVFHRYLRLAPLYLVIVLSADLLYMYMGDTSVYHVHERSTNVCGRNWIRNLLFTQNFFHVEEMCVNWSWSLACEMQYFIIATILLITYAKHPEVVKKIVVGLLVATCLWTYVTGLRNQYQFSFDVLFVTGTDTYVSPFVRVLPYILGSIAAWYLQEKHHQLEISETTAKHILNLALAAMIVCFITTSKRDMHYFISTSLYCFGRAVFAVAGCWFIISSATGTRTWWSRLLEAECFQHIGRVSYATYLSNPLLITFFYGMTTSSSHVDPFMLTIICIGFFVMVYLVAMVLTLTFEMPYCNWSSVLLKNFKQKSS